jgi:predicted transcriptional regulator
MRTKLIMPSKQHKAIAGLVLRGRREKTGLSQCGFAAACGHSQQYQQRLEVDGLHEITIEKARTILGVLEKYTRLVV